jgi:hypothetical protein
MFIITYRRTRGLIWGLALLAAIGLTIAVMVTVTAVVLISALSAAVGLSGRMVLPGSRRRPVPSRTGGADEIIEGHLVTASEKRITTT